MSSRQHVPAHAISRPALLRQLDDAIERPVTLVVAQAGAGKSVLLAQWLNTLNIQKVWIDVTDADNNPEYFVRHVLNNISTDDGTKHLDRHPIRLAGPVLGPGLVDELESVLSDGPPCVVVLDDLHNLRNPELLADLGTLLEQLPANVHVVVSTRTDPPVARGRGRLRDEIVELRGAELALTDVESAALLSAVSGKTLDGELTSALAHRTEGWAAGLQLAAMTLRRHPDPGTFVANFSGSDRLVADYLSEEVVASLPRQQRDLLFSMAALDRFDAELIAHLTGIDDAHGALEQLQRESMFLIPLGDRYGWFRFHQLFRDLLRYQARAADPTAERDVLVRAARWHVDRGEWQPSVDYLLRAQEWNRAISLILARGSDVFERGEIGAVIDVIRRTPESIRAASIDLTLLLGILIGITGRADASEDLLRRVSADESASVGQRLCAETFLASLAQWRPNATASVQWASSALALLDAHPAATLPDLLRLTDRESLSTIATVSGGRAHFLAGNLDEARRWLGRALQTRGAAYSLWRISALGSLALLEAWVGHTTPARELADESLMVAAAVSAEFHPSTAEAYLAIGLAALQNGNQTAAAEAMEDGWVRASGNGRTQLEWVFFAASRALYPPLRSRTAPAGQPPPIAADRLATTERSDVQPKSWVAARVTSAASGESLTLAAGRGAHQTALPDPLTDRELEVLAYLPTRITSRELAQQFYVSVNTIKTHTAHIYRKLGVTNRDAAITRATELGLLRW